MNAKFDTMDAGEKRIVYVRAVRADDLPEAIRAQAGGKDVIYAVHGANGEPLALAVDRAHAFAVARINEFTPVSVH